MKHRLYLPPPLSTGMLLTLDAERAHYLTRVLRLRRGARLECFDGEGRAWAARLHDVQRATAVLHLENESATEPAPSLRLHLVQALLKGAAMDRVVQKATELGATDVWLVDAARSNVPDASERRDRKRQHWQKIVQSAAEQSGRLHLPTLHPVTDLATFLAAAPAARLLMLQPGAEPLPLELPRQSIAVLIGPEGGWSDDEQALARRSGVAEHGLGGLVLRAETAPLAVLSAIRHGWRWG